MFKNLFPKILLLALLIFLIVVIDNHSLTHAQIGNLLGQTPATTDFILSWSTDSYVPANYEGKALTTKGSEIRVVAEPIKKLSQDPDKLYYRWLLDGDIAGYASGQGKSVFRFQATKWAGDVHEVKVDVLDADENLLASKTVSIKVVEPELLLTKRGSTYAISNKLATGTGQEIKFSAVPLFFHIQNLNDVIWQWSFAGQVLYASDEKDPNSLVLKIPSGKLSQILEKSLSVNAINKKDQYQQSSVNLNIEIK